MLRTLRSTTLVLLLAWLLAPGAARAVLTIEITQGIEGALPIAIVPFGWQGGGAPPVDIARIISSDLRRSGRFSPLPSDALPERPVETSEVNFPAWRGKGADNLVIGRVRPGGGGDYVVQFQLLDVLQGSLMAGQSYQVGAHSMRHLAHQIADIIYQKLTGERGAFATRIAYVTLARGAGQTIYTLNVADADGYNPQPVLRSVEPVLSPAWSLDGRELAYVSMEKRRVQIYIQNVSTGERHLISSTPGLNSAPAWSPDGRYLAMTLSKDGNPEIYTLNLASGTLHRITDNPAIDTEPAWSPDGRSIIFTSNRGGGPQLYRVSAGGGGAQRLTFEGDYNSRASISPDGRTIAMVHRDGGGYRIAALDLQSNALRELSAGPLDESPSFAPNGTMIIYATRGGLAAVSVDGRVRQRLSATEGAVREPAWSPFER